MKKFFALRLIMATVIGISIVNPFGDERQGKVAYASQELRNTGNMPAGNTEKFKAEFAYEMAKITAKIVSAPTTNVADFKIEFAYATAQVTAKALPILPSGQRDEFAYEMARITAKIINDRNINVEKAKAEFAYEISQLTTKIIANAEKSTAGNRTMLNVYNAGIETKAMGQVNSTGAGQPASLLRNNADLEPRAKSQVNNAGAGQTANLLRNNAYIAPKATGKTNNTGAGQKAKARVNPGDISKETYTELIDELMNVGDRSKSSNKVNIDGEIRYHYAANRGFSRDSSGFRLYLGADYAIDKNWRVYAMLEGQKSVLNYNNKFELSRLYIEGKTGESTLKAGYFGYFMAEGNIYDSGFKGASVAFGEPVKYTVAYGKTEDTKETTVVTARYNDFDYNLEAGMYYYQMADGQKNTIWTFGGNYNFSNFGVGAMYLGSSLKDSQGGSNGYVLSLNYGDLKTYRPGTYQIFAKYYNQPQYTYIAHGMNGLGGRMYGFKGYGLGTRYTFAPEFVAGIEYYNLKDKISGEKGETWWSQLTHYF